jgi:hypothetical protein
VEADDLNARFPAERLARVTLRLADGRVLKSATTPARGDAERPLSDAEILEKHRMVAAPTLGARTEPLLETISAVHHHGDVRALLDLVLTPAA